MITSAFKIADAWFELEQIGYEHFQLKHDGDGMWTCMVGVGQTSHSYSSYSPSAAILQAISSFKNYNPYGDDIR